MNRKALAVFLGSTFGLTIALSVIARLAGFSLIGTPAIMSQMVVLAAMFVPAISAVFTQKIVLKKSLKDLGFKWGPFSAYLKTYGMIVLFFIINYAIIWLFIMQPDFTLRSFIDQYAPGIELPAPPGMMIALLSFITFVGAPVMNMIPSLGEEIGWRGFLLPNLEPLGKIRASILSGVIWALWHTPMILILGFLYGNQLWPGVILHFILVTGLGIWMGYIWFRTRSTILAAFIHAVFNANAYGIWTILFVSNDRLIIGAAGVIGASLCLILGAGTVLVMYRTNRSGPAVKEQDS